MANAEHLKILDQGREAWNAWRKDHPIRWPESMNDPSWTDGGRLNFIETDSSIPDLTEANLSQRNLRGYDLSVVRLCGANLAGADLQETDVAGSLLRNSILSGARLPLANFGNTELQESDLTNANLSLTVLFDANLSQANLQGVNGGQGRFRRANFSGANLSHADFHNADFSGGNLYRADLRQTMLVDVNFCGVNLSEADLEKSTLKEVIFGGANLKDAKLSNCRFLGPCTIDHRTLQKSGSLPLTFLLGCGLPEVLIEFLPSLIRASQENPVQFYECFISFSESDDLFAQRLYNDLQGEGVRCWRWKEDATIGRPLMKEIDEAIRVYDKLIVICSEKSLNSPAVIREIERALQKEDSHRRTGNDPDVLVPIRIDDFVLQRWNHYRKADVVEKTIGDFREWDNPVQYRKALEKFLKDLKGLEK